MNTSELTARIIELKKQKNAVILAHYYTSAEVQAVADFLGDSLALYETKPCPRDNPRRAGHTGEV